MHVRQIGHPLANERTHPRGTSATPAGLRHSVQAAGFDGDEDDIVGQLAGISSAFVAFFVLSTGLDAV
jgi:hypothetical protein